MRQEGAGDHGDAFARNQFFGHPHGFARIGAVVAGDHFQFLAEYAALRIDFLNRHFPTLLVGIEEGRLRLVAVELADLDGVLRRCRRHEAGREETRDREILHMALDHDFAPCVAITALHARDRECLNPRPYVASGRRTCLYANSPTARPEVSSHAPCASGVSLPVCRGSDPSTACPVRRRFRSSCR